MVHQHLMGLMFLITTTYLHLPDSFPLPSTIHPASMHSSSWLTGWLSTMSPGTDIRYHSKGILDKQREIILFDPSLSSLDIIPSGLWLSVGGATNQKYRKHFQVICMLVVRRIQSNLGFPTQNPIQNLGWTGTKYRILTSIFGKTGTGPKFVL